MKIAAIIAEYNPFHKGHAYQIEKTRRDTGADRIIAVMSPDFVQRGEPAVFDKHVRTRMALTAGADAVLELPVTSAVGSAEFFARGGVSLIDRLGCIDLLSFGCETPDLEVMKYAAEILNEEPAYYKAALHNGLAKGLSFPAARSAAVLSVYRSIPDTAENISDAHSHAANTKIMEKDAETRDAFSDKLEQLLRSPNNILALEYVRALTALKSSIQPYAIERVGQGYHSLDADAENYTSAAAIRKMLYEAGDSRKMLYEAGDSRKMLYESAAVSAAAGETISTASHCTASHCTASHNTASQSKMKCGYSSDLACAAPYLNLIPACLKDSFLSALQTNSLPSIERFDLLLRYALAEAAEAGSLTTYLDVSEELASRIKRSLNDYESAEQFTQLLSARNFPASRVRRALLHVLLKIRSDDVLPGHAAFEPSYARILGFRKSASDLMHQLKKTSTIPLITKPSAAAQILDEQALAAFRQDIHASAVYGMLFPGNKKENEYTRSPIILDID